MTVLVIWLKEQIPRSNFSWCRKTINLHLTLLHSWLLGLTDLGSSTGISAAWSTGHTHESYSHLLWWSLIWRKLLTCSQRWRMVKWRFFWPKLSRGWDQQCKMKYQWKTKHLVFLTLRIKNLNFVNSFLNEKKLNLEFVHCIRNVNYQHEQTGKFYQHF